VIEAVEHRPPQASGFVDRVGGRTHEARVATFLDFACWDHHTHGKGDHRMNERAAQRLLTHHPEIARDSIYTAIVCGDIEEVRRIAAERPGAAREPGGPRGWTPILYLAFTRFTYQPTLDNAIEIARTLLDHGAHPNDYYMAGDARYSVLTGIAGEGEQDSPRQRYAAALFQLLLERGAEPFDIQVLYDTHFSGDMLWWIELVHAHTIHTDRRSAWEDPDWPMLDMRGYGSGARFLLETALKKRDLRFTEWLLSHGANPNAAPASDPRFPKRSLYEEALREGLAEMAELLGRYGATRRPPVLDDEEQFLEACFRLDREAAQAHLQKHPEYLQSTRAIFEAATRDRPDVIALLLELGVPLEIEDRQKARALHHAAASGAGRAARFLLERGVDIDPRDGIHDNTPLGWAAHFDDRGMLDLLSQYSRDVWHLAFCGYVDRLREVLRADPDLAKQVTRDGITPLWWLPDDEARAMEIVDMLLAAGVDPAIRSREGRTAMDWALKRGMADVARRIAVDDAAEPPPLQQDLERFEKLARNILIAHESGDPAALEAVHEHFGRRVTWEELRSGLRSRHAAILGKDPGTSFLDLDSVRLILARHKGFDDWAALVKAISAGLRVS
jgi:ankyrin repeat protein